MQRQLAFDIDTVQRNETGESQGSSSNLLPTPDTLSKRQESSTDLPHANENIDQPALEQNISSPSNSCSNTKEISRVVKVETTKNAPSSKPGTSGRKHEDRMQRKLKYYFMNPWEKYKTKGRIPYKLLAQLFKIILVTMQLIIFGHNSANQVTFVDNNTMAFRHLFLEGWDATQETPPYPPSHGPFAVYTYEEFYSKLDYAWSRYYHTVGTALGTFDFAVPGHPEMVLCKRYFQVGDIFASNQSYEFDSQILHTCKVLKPLRVFNESTNSTMEVFDTQEFLRQNNMSINFDRMLMVWLKFSLKTVQLKAYDLDPFPNCFQFNVTITFDNTKHDGEISVTLIARADEIFCHGRIRHNPSQLRRTLLMGLDVFVILLTLASCISCARSLYKGRQLYKIVEAFFRERYKEDIKEDRGEFLNGWFILIIVNDILIIVGSAFKLQMDNKTHCFHANEESEPSASCTMNYNSKIMANDYAICSYLLGIGAMLVWFGVLRYMAFSYKNYVLILTLRHAIPSILRFMMCALMIFLAFALGGWIVLGPYNIKFRSFSSSLECLFSLINGDDMFATFSSNPGDSPNTVIGIFSRIYVYLFVSLFTYVVLSIFITLIIEVYEDVKKCHANRGRQKTFMWRFIRREVGNFSKSSTDKRQPRTGPTLTSINEDTPQPTIELHRHRHHHHRRTKNEGLQQNPSVEGSIQASQQSEHAISWKTRVASGFREFPQHLRQLCIAIGQFFRNLFVCQSIRRDVAQSTQDISYEYSEHVAPDIEGLVSPSLGSVL